MCRLPFYAEFLQTPAAAADEAQQALPGGKLKVRSSANAEDVPNSM
jgi:hypothetical protein